MLATLPIDMIENGQRLRGISEAQVALLVNSIADVGLLNPITVYRRKLMRGGDWVDGYGLVAGLHRKTACERLGLTEIDALVLDLDDLHRQIAECDENLCAPSLTPSERAQFTKRRKEAYEALHPETRSGVAGANARHHATDQMPVASFAANTAAATGVNERTVRRDAERGTKIIPGALALVHGTKLDTSAYLNVLKDVDPAQQIAKVKRDLTEGRKPRSVAAVKLADDPLDDFSAKERQIRTLMSAWNKASAEARAEFLERIDTPVFDRAQSVRVPSFLPAVRREVVDHDPITGEVFEDDTQESQDTTLASLPAVVDAMPSASTGSDQTGDFIQESQRGAPVATEEAAPLGEQSAAPIQFTSAKALRPDCLNPGCCAGQGKQMCWSCLKAAGQAA